MQGRVDCLGRDGRGMDYTWAGEHLRNQSIQISLPPCSPQEHSSAVHWDAKVPRAQLDILDVKTNLIKHLQAQSEVLPQVTQADDMACAQTYTQCV